MVSKAPIQGQIVEVVAGSWADDGTSRCTLPSGWELRIFGLIPGERCKVRITHRSQGARVAWAESTKVTEVSSFRRRPPCRHSSACGACGLLHVDDGEQFRLKVESAQEQLPNELVSTLLPTDGWITAPSPFSYRHKAVFLPHTTPNRLELGGYARGTHDVVPLPYCEVLTDALSDARNTFREELEPAVLSGVLPLRTLVLRANRRGQVLATLVLHNETDFDTTELAERLVATSTSIEGVHLQVHSTPGDSVTGRGPVAHLAGAERIQETVLGQAFSIRPLSFFQVNPPVLEAIVLLLQARLSPGSTRKELGHSAPCLLDLYCGGGVLGLATLADRADWQLIGVDMSAANIEDARENTVRSAQPNASFRRGRVEDVLEDFSLERATAAIIDPPRSGLRPAVLEALSRRGPEQLFYVACSTKALSRDASALFAAGYRAEFLCPTDMMPQTPYVEWIAGFRRTSPPSGRESLGLNPR